MKKCFKYQRLDDASEAGYANTVAELNWYQRNQAAAVQLSYLTCVQSSN
jgi:hypothetical protein